MPRLIPSCATFTKASPPPNFQGDGWHYKQEIWVSFPRVKTKSACRQAELGDVHCEFFEGGDEVLFIMEHVPRVALNMSMLPVSSDRGDHSKDSHQNSTQCFLGAGSPWSSLLLGAWCVCVCGPLWMEESLTEGTHTGLMCQLPLQG